MSNPIVILIDQNQCVIGQFGYLQDALLFVMSFLLGFVIRCGLDRLKDESSQKSQK